MLTHLELGDLVELLLRDVTVVHAQDVALFLSDASSAKRIGSVGVALLGDGDTSDLCSVVETCKFSESAPATANVQQLVRRLEMQLRTHDRQLVVLQLLERLIIVDVGNHARSVDHMRKEEPAVEVIDH